MLFLLSFLPGLTGAAAAPQSDPVAARPASADAALRALAEQADKELRGDILPFWLDHARDTLRGGFHGFIDSDLAVRPDAPRGALLTSRILWTFSAAYRRYHDPAYLEMAQWAFRDLVDRFVDRDNGGLFWTVSPGGEPVDARKQTYGQVFGIYGLSEYYRATGDKEALRQAIALYRAVEEHARDRVNGGYFEAFTRSWTRLNDSKPGIVAPSSEKSQNTHIHIVEAYTNLLRVWPDPGLRSNQRALMELILTRIVDPSTHHLVLFLRDDWTPSSTGISYGHDIELSWLVVEAARVLGDPDLLARARTTSLAIASATLSQGVDAEGGIYNEGDPRGVTDAGKEWWPQAEGATGFLNAYQLSGDSRYLAASLRTWGFILDKFIDRKYGDWYQTLDSRNVAQPRPKVTVWKCPYHNGRSCMELIERAGELLNGS